jgi:uncharacterized protein
MEDILASIRRIIADDDRTKPAAKAAEPVMPQPSPVAPPPPAAPLRPATLPPRIANPPPPRPAAPPPPLEVARQPEFDVVATEAELEGEPASDILDLTEQMAAPASPAGFRTIDGQSDLVFDEAAPVPEPEPPRRPMVEHAERPLVSSVTTAAVDSAFNTLAQTVLVQNGRTLEDLVREMLRPLLKTWLDDNLPGMVERLVRAEIERVSRGRT